MPTTTDVWRWWPTVCHSLVACSLLQFKAMGNRRGELLTGMVALKRARRRKETTCPKQVGPLVTGSQDFRAVARRGSH